MGKENMYAVLCVSTVGLVLAYVTSTASGLSVPLGGESTGQPEVGATLVTSQYCEYACTMGGHWQCFPPPCPPPMCVNPSKYWPTDCCEFCLDGPNCSAPDGNIIRMNHTKIIDGKNCTCLYPPMPATCK